MVCFLALMLEASFQRLLRDRGTSASYSEVLDDLGRLRAVRFEDVAKGEKWLWRTELEGNANDAFQAVGMRIPPRVHPLN